MYNNFYFILKLSNYLIAEVQQINWHSRFFNKSQFFLEFLQHQVQDDYLNSQEHSQTRQMKLSVMQTGQNEAYCMGTECFSVQLKKLREINRL